MTCKDTSFDGVPTHKLEHTVARLKNEIAKRKGEDGNKIRTIQKCKHYRKHGLAGVL